MIKRFGVAKELRRHFATSAELRAHVRREFGDTAIVSFSRGKDAIGAWLALREVFPRVLAFHLDNLPGLGFIDESIDYYNKFFGVTIERYIHPSFYRQLDALAYQSPERCSILEKAKIRRSIDYRTIEDDMRTRFNAPNAWVATGVRAADSFVRRTAIKKYGAMTWTKKKFHAIFDWKAEQLLDAIRASGVKLPPEYRWFGRTFDGIHVEYLHHIQKHRPADYRVILDWFPMAGAELARERIYAKHGLGGVP